MGADEQTFIMIKPDGVQRGLVGKIVERFETRGFKLVAMKFEQPSLQKVEKHYADLAGKPFFPGMCAYMSSGPVVTMVWEGLNAVAMGRKMLGATMPADSEPGTIRGDFCLDVGRNLCHGSDAVESAKAEIALWFHPKDLVCWNDHSAGEIYEKPVVAVAAAPAPKKEPAAKKEAAPKKEAAKKEEVAAAVDPVKEAEKAAKDAAKLLAKAIKEGGKKGVELEGASDMGGLEFFCTQVDTPDGDMMLLEEVLFSFFFLFFVAFPLAALFEEVRTFLSLYSNIGMMCAMCSSLSLPLFTGAAAISFPRSRCPTRGL
ncbi:nucleoside diphosphate kinase [Pavlovales sp. CCMP2436]|nr:nucleoside diphosphate kinase [Pavlovales sp. CCMP2436]